MWLALTGLGLVAAAYVAMAEVAAIVSEATPTGGTTLSALFGIGQLTSVADWAATIQTLNAWAGAVHQLSRLTPHDLVLWLSCYLAFDLLFIAGYAWTGFQLLPQDRPPARNRAPLTGPREKEPARRLLTVLIIVQVVQDLFAAVLFLCIARNWGSHDPFGIALHFVIVAKWLAAVVFALRVAYLAWDVGVSRRAIGSAVSALWVQRYSLVLIVMVTVIAAARGSDILEQMPDVPRAWLTASGWEPALVAVVAEALLALLLVALGRLRTRHAVDKYSDQARGTDGRRPPAYRLWFTVPVILVLLAIALRAAGVVEVGWARLTVAAAVPLFIGVSSVLIAWRTDPAAGATTGPGRWRWLREQSAGRREPAPSPTVPRLLTAEETAEVARKAASVRTAGDALAAAAVAVPGLGLIRSFTGTALLSHGWYTGASWAAVAIGFVFATLTWPAANGPGHWALGALAGTYKTDPGRSLVARLADSARRGPRPQPFGRDNAWPWLLLGAPFLIAVGFLLFLPLAASRWLGVLGTVVITLGTLTVMLAVLAHLAGTRQPVQLFRILRLNGTPVLGIILLVGLLGGVVDSKSLLHVTRGPVKATSLPWGVGQHDLPHALRSWLAGSAACAIPEGSRAVRVQPLILVAAAGGGIRAAWWADNVMAKFADSPCGRRDVFAVSSVSGGSVGLAVLDTEPAGGNAGAEAEADITRMAGPGALAAGLDGLLLHDTIAGFTGLDLPAAQLPAGQPFADRADLIESAWSGEDPALTHSFPLQDPALPWRLLLNSTTVGTGCRAVIADRALTAPPAVSALQRVGAAGVSPVTCDLQTSADGDGSYDFFQRLPCQQGITAVTAAMLSARFPFVTPSGVVTGCGASQAGIPVGQFVDGGYADSSGLMTIADLLPMITSELRPHNASALAQPHSPAHPATVVVPLVMYLGNSARPVAVPQPVPPLEQEPAIPVDTKSAATGNFTVSDTLLQRIGDAIGNGQWLDCDQTQASCQTEITQARRTVADQLYLVAPSVTPQISAPLGWVLSPVTQQSLGDALTREAGYHCVGVTSGVCEPDVGHLGDLLALTGR